MPTADEILENLRALLNALPSSSAGTEEGGQSTERSDHSAEAKVLQDLATRFGASTEPLPTEDRLFLHSGANILPARKNPVKRPDGAQFGAWFDVLNTADGQRIAQALGPRSGFFAEYSNWAPSVSFFFDLLVHLIELTQSEDLQQAVRSALVGVCAVLAKAVDLSVVTLAQRRIQAAHASTPLEHAWKTLATSVRLGSQESEYTPKLVRDTIDKLREQIQKSSLRAQADSCEQGHHNTRNAHSFNQGNFAGPWRGGAGHFRGDAQ